MRARTYAVPPDLADVAASYWVGEWDLRGQEPHVTALLGDPCVHLVFEESQGAQAGSRLVGVWTRLWERRLEGHGRVRGVKLRAGAVRAFLPCSAAALSNRIDPLSSRFSDVDAVEPSLRSLPDDAAAFEVLTGWLRAHRRDDSQVSLAVALVERIVGDPSVRTVETLAERAGLGPRALQRLFRDHVGAAPKWVIRRNRLQEVALRLERGEAVSLAALAQDLGYADQAHLARDFKSVVGKSPSEFAVAVHR